jgi:hypothetical protein
VVVRDTSAARLFWVDAQGRRQGRTVPALLQHVFGPAMPAFAVRAPSAAGEYQLVFCDEQGHRLAATPYRVVADLPQGPARTAGLVPGPHVTLESRGAASSTCGRVIIENRTASYVQALSNRPQEGRSVRAHPGMFYAGAPWAGSVSLVMWWRPGHTGDRPRAVRLLLPQDLPPHGRLALDLPADLVPAGGTLRRPVSALVVDP